VKGFYEVLRKRRQKSPVLYLMPAFCLIIFTFIYPVFRVVAASFTRTYRGKETFAGLLNFKLIFQDPVFWTALKNNATLFLAIPIIIFFSTVIAAVLYDKIKFWRFYRGIIFTPYIIAIPVIGIVFSYILQPKGPLNLFLGAFHLGFMAHNWLADPQIVLFGVMGVITWHELGFGVVLYTARLMSVDISLFDAAKVDGASWWQRFFYITLPQLRSVMEFHTVLLVITMLGWSFDYIYVMTFGGPGTSSYVSELYIYLYQFKFNLPNIASAVALILLFFAIVLISAITKMTGGWKIEYE